MCIRDWEEERAGGRALQEELGAERRRGADLEAHLEKQLSDSDTEREQLRARLHREEALAAGLRDELERLRRALEQLRRPGLAPPRKARDQADQWRERGGRPGEEKKERDKQTLCQVQSLT